MLLKSKPIQTQEQVISVQGKVFYNDRRRRIDLKKPIRDLFESASTETIMYMMELCLSNSKVMERLEELSAQGVLPVLLYFIENDNEMPGMRK